MGNHFYGAITCKKLNCFTSYFGKKQKNEKVEKIYFDVKCLFHLVSTLFYEVYKVFAYYNRI